MASNAREDSTSPAPGSIQLHNRIPRSVYCSSYAPKGKEHFDLLTEFFRVLALFTVLLSVSSCSKSHLVETLVSACENYPLTQSQRAYLKQQSLEIAIPVGSVPVIQRCDINYDNVVDLQDIRAIGSKRNRPAAHPDDPMDWDRDSIITALDVRGCQRVCSYPDCSASGKPSRTSAKPAGVVENAPCFQVVDLTGDGKEDFVGIFEHTGKDRPLEGWTIKVVILYLDDNGDARHVIYPFAGKRTKTALLHHMSRQPAGVVDLMPGSVKIDQPGVVHYQNGIPKVLYFYRQGRVNRAYYGIDD